MLDRFEYWLRGLLEGNSARLLGGEVQPIQIARYLLAAMDAHPLVAPSGPIAPNVYEVHLHPEDYLRFAAFSASLSTELVRYLTGSARERGISFLRPPQVTLVEDPNVRRRDMDVHATFSDPPRVPGVQSANLQNAGGSASGLHNTVPLQGAPTPGQPARPVPPVLGTAGQVRAELWLGPNARGPEFFIITQSVTTIGRALECDLVLSATDVSREHAQIRLEKGKYTLVDLNSTNGTLVNGRTVKHSTLRNGDRVSCGGVEMTFRTQKLKAGS